MGQDYELTVCKGMVLLMRNLRMIVSYDGTDYHGFQTQPTRNTIQDKLQNAIKSLTGENVQVYGSGRTDAGVHAKGQVIHFHTGSKIPIERWALALNCRLPASIAIQEADEVRHDFHAQHSAKKKTYRYAIRNSKFPNVFERKFQLHLSRSLDLSAMKEAASFLIGTFEYTSFCSKRTSKENHERTLYRSEWVQEEDVLYYFIEGNGFLYNMVRIIVGTMIEVGDGKRAADSISDILLAKDRGAAGPTAPALGLSLWYVEY
jgi:tRNA pseudouridine38-40 synthase